MTIGVCGCVGADTGTARFSMNAKTAIISAVEAAITPAYHITVLAFASATSPFVASVGNIVSNLVSSLVSLSLSPVPLPSEGGCVASPRPGNCP